MLTLLYDNFINHHSNFDLNTLFLTGLPHRSFLSSTYIRMKELCVLCYNSYGTTFRIFFIHPQYAYTLFILYTLKIACIFHHIIE